MKTKIIMLIAFILIATTDIYAQGFQRRTVPERVKMTMEKLAPLSLDATQQHNTDSVFTDFFTAQQKMLQDARVFRQASRPKRVSKIDGRQGCTIKSNFYC